MFIVVSFWHSEDAADGRVRFQGLRLLLWLRRDRTDHATLAAGVCRALLARDRALSATNSRHFARQG